MLVNDKVTLKEKLKIDMKQSMKDKLKLKTLTIRMIFASIKQFEVDNRVLVDEKTIIQIITKMIKQRKDSYNQYKKANREDLANKEQDEINILEKYLPKALTNDEINNIIQDAINSINANSMKDMGKIMKIIKPSLVGKADMTIISKLVKSKLC